MNKQTLRDTARQMLAEGKGLLAMDESNPTADKRFAALGIPQTVEMRRAYRDLIVTAPGLAESIGGAILYDETIRQTALDGTPFAQALQRVGIIPGIKVDEGAKPLALHEGELVTLGLDGLRERLAEYSKMGARFAKWRAVITIDDANDAPSRGCIEANAHALARYAALCQEAGIVPIVEPEVLMDGGHTLARCGEVTERSLHAVFEQLRTQRVDLAGMLLKPNMVVPGLACPAQASADEVADATIDCFRRTVPAAVAGIAFLSGGQSAADASARLNAMNLRHKGQLPWPVAFSFARAIQDPAMKAWSGKAENVAAAQAKLVERARLNRLARRGEYTAAMEPAR
ncbi:class I fructose-bisphosphate aldolase [Paucibacter sp. R3-3]|uniref:fructose-bisphosphate aldolase n=1 Tax=Roseateles agri TaxID=3098619 RepID=A0ABU5DHQ1_9BURK|nr:class I fructose-bisphosphate aldolase [Paucibacter sp. R3-3]MDY0745820.1 class I fructose-bisphosphate aldolase [Paucibacter sp. R3-3]